MLRERKEPTCPSSLRDAMAEFAVAGAVYIAGQVGIAQLISSLAPELPSATSTSLIIKAIPRPEGWAGSPQLRPDDTVMGGGQRI